MSFIVPLPETLFQNKIKEVSVISYSTDEDLEHVKNAYRLVVVPPFKISEAAEMLNSYGMMLLGVQAVVDKCGIWIDKESEEDNPCEQDIVLFLIFSPAHTNMHEVEIQDALAKIKKLAGLKQ